MELEHISLRAITDEVNSSANTVRSGLQLTVRQMLGSIRLLLANYKLPSRVETRPPCIVTASALVDDILSLSTLDWQAQAIKTVIKLVAASKHFEP